MKITVSFNTNFKGAMHASYELFAPIRSHSNVK